MQVFKSFCAILLDFLKIPTMIYIETSLISIWFLLKPVNTYWNTCTDLRGWKGWWRDQGQDWGHEEVNPANSIFKILDCRGRNIVWFLQKAKILFWWYYHYQILFVFTFLLGPYLDIWFIVGDRCQVIHCDHIRRPESANQKWSRLDMIIIKNKWFYLFSKMIANVLKK